MPGRCCCDADDRRSLQVPTIVGSDTVPVPRGSLYERVGGDEWFLRLVDHFYDGVETDPVLRRFYPADLAGPRKRLAMFLAQYFGGPPAYSAARGHPRLRMRHFRFPIGPAERDAWLGLMSDAVRAGGLDRDDEVEVLRYFASTATMLMNVRIETPVAPVPPPSAERSRDPDR